MSMDTSQINTITESPIDDSEQWYVMRAYKSENIADERLSEPYGLKHFIPKQTVIRTHSGKKILTHEPVIHSLVFVYATRRQIIHFKRNYYNSLQFVTTKLQDRQTYLTVPCKQMEDFITVCRQREQDIHFYRPEDISDGQGIAHIKRGQKVRIHGGSLDNVEGYMVKVAKRRGHKFVVILLDLLAVSAEVDPQYIEIIK